MPAQVDLEVLWQKAHKYLLAGKPKKALPLLRKLSMAMPNDPAVIYNLGACLFEIGHVEEALRFALKANSMDSNESEFLKLLAKIYFSAGDFINSLKIYEKLNTDGLVDIDIYTGYADTLLAVENYFEAIKYYEKASQIEPNNFYLLNRLGECSISNSEFSAAIKYLTDATGIEGDNSRTLFSLGRAYQSIGELEKALSNYKKSMDSDVTFSKAEKSYKFLLLNIPKMSSDDLLDAHVQIGNRYIRKPNNKHRTRSFSRDKNKKLKIGFVSSDFRTHVVALNILPLIRNIDRHYFSIHLFSDVNTPDDLTLIFQENCDQWCDITKLKDHEVAKKIGSLDIDIVLYLAGRFDGNRPEIASYRPAPVQISYHDCATTGLPEMDYWLTDNLLNPDKTEEKFTERLYRLPFFYQFESAKYIPQLNLPKLDLAPSQKSKLITFGCLNKPEKINDFVVESWARILQSVPNSQLLLKYFDHYSDPTISSLILGKFRQYDILPDRLLLKRGIASHLNHMEILGEIDIALDTFPFNGATTTIEALKMGVPVISFWGKHFVDRVGATLTTQAGFPELAAGSIDEYVNIAVSLAKDRSRIQLYRETIQDSLFLSPLFDEKLYANNMENAFHSMWDEWCQEDSRIHKS